MKEGRFRPSFVPQELVDLPMVYRLNEGGSVPTLVHRLPAFGYPARPGLNEGGSVPTLVPQRVQGPSVRACRLNEGGSVPTLVREGEKGG